MKLWQRVGLARKQAPAYRVQVDGFGFECRHDQSVLEAAEAAGVPFPFNCRVGACGTCRCRIQQGSFRTARPLNYMLTPDELANGITLACQTYAASDLVVAFPPSTWHTAYVDRIQALDADVLEVTLKLEQALAFVPGQYVHMQEPGTGLRRIYSMVNDPGGHSLVFHIKIRADGAMSAWWRNASIGAPLRVSAPAGTFRITDTGTTRFVCAAGGTGLGVIASLLLQQARRHARTDVLLLAINREDFSRYHRTAIAHLHDAAGVAIAGVNVPYRHWCAPDFAIEPYLRKHGVAAADWREDVTALLCGSDPVVDCGVRHCGNLGIPASRLIAHKYIAS